jgi:pyrimidine operon attenuation protein / uracil phosphoribosyltransferase
MKNYILDKNTAARKLQRMALQIAEQNVGELNALILAGIKDNGATIAKIIGRQLMQMFAAADIKVIEISLDKRNPGNIELSEQPDFNNKTIIVIDDVSNSGKTMLYALKPLLQYQPHKIQTLVLIERSHKAFPVHSDFVGISLATTLQEHIYVEVEGEEVSGAYLV